MLEKLIKRDKNEELEKILEEKKIEEQAKNLLQGILYKVEVSYKDYKKAKTTEVTEETYVQQILTNIKRKCNQIQIVKLSQKVEDEEIQKELEKNKFYIKNNVIISYPIEEKILYAIEKNSDISKIVNNKYGEITIPLSNLINTGKNIDRIEVLRDFNGWSWTTIRSEIENIKANLVYQTLRILLGEDFLSNWTKDTDGIIDYFEMMKEELTQKYNEKISQEIKETLSKIAIINETEQNKEFKSKIEEQIKQLDQELQQYSNTQEYITRITNHKKEVSKQIKEIEKILSQESRVKEEYTKRNAELPIDKKIFSIRIFKQQLHDTKQKLLNEIEEDNYLLNPNNFLQEKSEVEKQKELLEVVNYKENDKEKILIEFEKIFLKILKQDIEKQEEPEKIIKLIYQLRYYMLLPFNQEINIKKVKELQQEIAEIEYQITKKAIEKKVITKIPLEIMQHILQTRIIVLEELYFKIIVEDERYYVQIFDENITEDKFEIRPTEKMKINKKTKIFI